MSWWKALGFVGFLLGWLNRASRDGVITTAEMVELITAAVEQFDLDVQIKIEPAPPAPPSRSLSDGPDSIRAR